MHKKFLEENNLQLEDVDDDEASNSTFLDLDRLNQQEYHSKQDIESKCLHR